jgi:N-acetylglucosaminyldiphosphoundecaprenol N-acetyl-beta-D-mannosaminyltransferase|tara:strand:- start:169 stop:939 length:771 start_codon:yes stop_codon:yes gene_type:complete
LKIDKVKILNISIDSIEKSLLLTKELTGFIVTPNVDHLIKLQKDRDFYVIYKQADWVLCDSQIVRFFSIFLSRRIKEVITGSDLFPDYCKQVASIAENQKRIFILGGTTNEILNQSIIKLNSFSDIDYVVDGCSPPFGFEFDDDFIAHLIKKINSSGANVLAVGLGAPKQEFLINKIRKQLININLIFSIGATIDFISGELKRAPSWLQKIGMEWFFRMCSDPSRLIKRYLIEDLPIFLLILKQKLGLYENPFKNK